MSQPEKIFTLVHSPWKHPDSTEIFPPLGNVPICAIGKKRKVEQGEFPSNIRNAKRQRLDETEQAFRDFKTLEKDESLFESLIDFSRNIVLREIHNAINQPLEMKL